MCFKLLKARTEHFVIPAEAKYLAQIRDIATNYAERNRFSRKDMSSLKSSLDEICSNIVRHAYEGMERGDIQVRIQRRKNLINITIIDTGVAFDPSTIEAPDLGSYVQERRRGGMGFHLVKKLNDEVLYERVGNQNVIKIRRKIGSTVTTPRA
jgi:anti-sigma regulatory factor (Ser/Thr protein kinase)